MWTPNKEPATLRIGDTWQFTVCDECYPSGDGWLLTLTLINSANKITISADADPDGVSQDFLVDATVTAGYAFGIYKFQGAWINNTLIPPQQFTKREGTITLEPSFAQMQSFDGRTFARRMADALQNALETLVANPTIEVSVQGQTYTRTNLQQLKNELNKYLEEASTEDQIDAAKRGDWHNSHVRTQPVFRG